MIRKFARIISVGFGILFLNLSLAAEWQILPRIAVTTLYSDNIELAPEDSEEDEYVLQTSPGVRLRGIGNRAEFSVDYQLQNYTFSQDSNRNSTSHQLAALSTLELLDREFFLNASITFDQEIIDPRLPTNQANPLLVENYADRTITSLNPVYQHSFTQVADMDLSLAFTNTEYEGELSDSDSIVFVGELDSGNRLGRLQWFANGYDEQVDYGGDAEVHFLLYQLGLRYALTAKWGVFGTAGYEDNDFGDDSELSEGDVWSMGFRYTPVERFLFEASTGERYFGTTYTLLSRYQTETTRLEVEYVERPDTSSGRISAANAQPDPAVPESNLFLGTRAFLSKLLTLTLNKRFGGSEINVFAYDDLRELPEDDNSGGIDEHVRGYDSFWRWQFLPNTASNIAYGYREIEYIDGREDEVSISSVGVIHDLSRRTELTGEYRFSEQESSDPGSGFVENAAWLRVSMEF